MGFGAFYQRGRRWCLFVEELEPRLLLSGSPPTAGEQLFLQELNDARANPAAYGAAIGVDLSYVAPSPPLAFNPLLIQAARLHSQDMNDRGYFAHDTPGGITPAQRVAAAGFPGTYMGESIAGGAIFGNPATTLAALITDNGIPSLGHRNQLLSIGPFAGEDQVGIGAWSGNGPLGSYWTIDTGVGPDPRPFITGVVFTDANGNGKDDIGEGLGNVTITVAGAGATTTFDSGGYGIRVSPGTYTVIASGGGLAAPLTQVVTVGLVNLRLNFIGQPPGAWQAVTHLPAARTTPATVTGADGRIYVFGGFDANHQPSNSAEVYDPAGNTWTALANLPTARGGLAAARGSDGRLYAIGGVDAAGNALTTVEVYTQATNTWSAAASLNIARGYVAAVTGTDGRIYAVGGASGPGNPVASMEIYLPSANVWITSSAALPQPRSSLAAAVAPDGRIYAIGGADQGGFARSDVWVYDPSTVSWTAAAALPLPRAAAAAATGPDGRIYVLGGSDGSGDLNTAAAYTPAAGAWSAVAGMPTSRSGLAGALGGDGLIYAMGGQGSGVVLDAVESLSLAGQFQFSSAASSASDRDAGVTITVLRTGAGAGTVTVAYATQDGSATAGKDYTAISGTLTFAPGQTSQTFTVPLLNDPTADGADAFTVTLGSPTGGARLGTPATATVSLHDLSPDEAFVRGLYTDFLGRAGSVAEWGIWVAALPVLGRAGLAAVLGRSGEAFQHAVDGFFQRFLNRSPSAGEEAAWAGLMQAGVPEESVLADLLGSAEFAARAKTLAGGSNADADFIVALYSLVLNRPAQAAEVNAWLTVLPVLGRSGMAGVLMRSGEFRGAAIRTYYGDTTLPVFPWEPFFVDLLHRSTPPTAAEVAAWVNAPVDLLSIALDLAATAEYYAVPR
jgi:N-acetylneuraminic acid mutarotase